MSKPWDLAQAELFYLLPYSAALYILESSWLPLSLSHIRASRADWARDGWRGIVKEQRVEQGEREGISQPTKHMKTQTHYEILISGIDAESVHTIDGLYGVKF